MDELFDTIAPGKVLWITGLSSAGKTTIAKLVFDEVRAAGATITLVDGDAVRELMGGDLGHGDGDRLANAFRIARLCRFLSAQGHNVVCATMSLYDEIHQWNRQHIPCYTEVYVKVPLDVLRARDAKGLYRAAADGTATGVVGADLPFVPPRRPDIVYENTGTLADLRQFAHSLAQSILPAGKPTAAMHLKSRHSVFR